MVAVVTIIETLSEIGHREKVIGAALERIIRRGEIEFKMKRLYSLQTSVSRIEQHLSLWETLREGFFSPNQPYEILEVRIKSRKIITTVHVRAIYEIAKEELRKAAEELGINELVMERNWE